MERKNHIYYKCYNSVVMLMEVYKCSEGSEGKACYVPCYATLQVTWGQEGGLSNTTVLWYTQTTSK